MLNYYIHRGHSIKELLALEEDERLFYIAGMLDEIEKQEELSKHLPKTT